MKIGAVLLAAAAMLSAQVTPSERFEVVSVKQDRSGDQNSSTRPRPGGGLTVDRTGLTGTFDLALTWDPDLSAGQGVSMFAVQEQLGLKLDARRGPVAVLVIDNAELPAED